MAMDPHHVLTHDDMQYLWQVLNPEGGAQDIIPLLRRRLFSLAACTDCFR